MRLFTDLQAARDYAATLTGGEAVIYELFPDTDKEPFKVSVKP